MVEASAQSISYFNSKGLLFLAETAISSDAAWTYNQQQIDNKLWQCFAFKKQQIQSFITTSANSQFALGRMSQLQRNSIQSITRTHSFINRTPHTVLPIVNKDSWASVVNSMENAIAISNAPPNSNKGSPTPCNARCIRIEDCQISKQGKQQYEEHAIPMTIVNNILSNLTKLIITRCKITNLNLCAYSASTLPMPNLQQLDLQHNLLTCIPTFVFSCHNMVRLLLADNCIRKIDNQLKTLKLLNYLGILDNPVEYVGGAVLQWGISAGKLHIQWDCHILHQYVYYQYELHPDYPSNRHRTVTVNSENQDIASQCPIASTTRSLPAIPFLEEIYIDVEQAVKFSFSIQQQKNQKISKIVKQQLDVLLICQNLKYLSFVQEYLCHLTQKQLQQHIQTCFKQKLYASMNFLLIILQKKLLQKQILDRLQKCILRNNNSNRSIKQNKQKQSFQRGINIPKKSLASCNVEMDKQNSQVATVGRKKIKMLASRSTTYRKNIGNFPCIYKELSLFQPSQIIAESNDKQTCSDRQNLSLFQTKKKHYNDTKMQKKSTRNSKVEDKKPVRLSLTNIQKQVSNSDAQQVDMGKLLLPKLVTFNLQLYSTISKTQAGNVTIDQFIWFLNQVENYPIAHKVAEELKNNNLKQIFNSSIISFISNNIVNSQLALQTIFSFISFKPSLKYLLMYTDIKFLQNFNFQCLPIIRGILLLEDLQCLIHLQKKYNKFAEVLFRNNAFILQLTQTQTQRISISSIPMTESVSGIIGQKSEIENNKNRISWKQLLPPSSKLYKYLYKQQKKYIRSHLSLNGHNNYHFPQYMQSQPVFARNDVHDYEKLKDYQEFQASFYHKDFKLRLRTHNSNQAHPSIAKRIYLHVLGENTNLRRKIKSRNNIAQNLNRSEACASYCKQSENNQKEFSTILQNINLNKTNQPINHISSLKQIKISTLSDLNFGPELSGYSYTRSSQKSQFDSCRKHTLRNAARKYNAQIERSKSKCKSISLVSCQKKSYKKQLDESNQRCRKKKIGIQVISNSQNQLSPYAFLASAKKQSVGLFQSHKDILLDSIKKGSNKQSINLYQTNNRSKNKNYGAIIKSCSQINITSFSGDGKCQQQNGIIRNQQIQCSNFDYT